jgi:hypothetical protein
MPPRVPTPDQFWTIAVTLRKLNREAQGRNEGRKEIKLIEKTIERTEAEDTPTPSDEPSVLDTPITRLVPGADTDVPNGRRERRARRVSSAAEPLDFDTRRERRARRASSAPESLHPEPATADVIDPDNALTAIEATHTDREARRAASGERRRRPRAPRAEKMAADSATTVDEDEPAGESAQLPETSAITAEALAVAEAGKKPNRSSHTLKRAQRKQQQAKAALEEAGDSPVLGALNRHLNMMTQQLGTAHRVIGRVAAERDALRQQLADLQGIPVEEIVVSSIGVSKENEDRPEKTREPAEPPPPSAMARLNYFRHEDIQVMRRRRQIAALCLLGVVLGLWLLGRMGFWHMPANVSKDSLSGLPLIGELMSYFLAGWVFYRIVRVGGKGVKWVFPTDQKRRRR